MEVLNPYANPATCDLVNQFFEKYYSDQNERMLLIGINPGRFGSGLTGIGFTDPINLESKCGIPNEFDKKPELSSQFMYQMMEQFGGVNAFYSRFLFTSVSPLGFVKNGKNLNYYDIPELKDKLETFMVDALKKQISMGGSNKIAFSIGMGENVKYLKYLNKKYQLFSQLESLPHPRWVMQYRRKRMQEFIDEYINKLSVL